MKVFGYKLQIYCYVDTKILTLKTVHYNSVHLKKTQYYRQFALNSSTSF